MPKKMHKPTTAKDQARFNAFDKDVPASLLRRVLNWRREFPSSTENDAVREFHEDSDVVRSTYRECGKYL